MRRIAPYGKYLFAAEATIHGVVEHQRRNLKQHIEEIGTESLLANTIEELAAELVDRFRLDVPKLNRDGITQLPNEEVDIDVSQDPMRGIFDRSQPFFVKGTMIRIAVPFSGEPELFTYGISALNGPIPGEVEDDALVLAYIAENPDLTVVQNDFNHRLNQIESTLRLIEGPAKEWNQQIANLISERLKQRRAKVERDQTLSLGYPVARPKSLSMVNTTSNPLKSHEQHYDPFLSHAHEDKEAIARPLYRALTGEGASVWFDEAVLKIGDSLRRKIDEGLARCRFGVVILSPRFLSKQWPQRELDGLVARETASGEKAILPIWHELDRDTLLRYSPPLADRLAGRSEDGIAALVKMILEVLH